MINIRALTVGTALLCLVTAGASAEEWNFKFKTTGAFERGTKGGLISVLSALTNQGKGNGGELAIAVTTPEGTMAGAITDIPVDDRSIGISASDPIGFSTEEGSIAIATDPGNSAGATDECALGC